MEGHGLDSSGLEFEQVAGACESCIQISGSIKFGGIS